jgi:monoamine oxidase
MGFILASHARGVCEKTSEERKRLICEQYARVFQSKEALNPIRYVEKNWMAEEYSGGCYVGFMQPGTMTQL